MKKKDRNGIEGRTGLGLSRGIQRSWVRISIVPEEYSADIGGRPVDPAAGK